ncbi:hypothetical protein DAPPUDRAFT_233164 [Daphnia pulex]|uniref:Uncharacterized protein n=1 Tax=Daphnia pulex TaxID=6669 RepID=E9FTE6_DAPPU|nr:hypothetical protein DAPPUDRAFT_233164 [Daphnia pulex]|eukprot:EFX89650.1 hypothetical protein DAPPUDRAFT_233164 [Daphnia pulex]
MEHALSCPRIVNKPSSNLTSHHDHRATPFYLGLINIGLVGWRRLVASVLPIEAQAIKSKYKAEDEGPAASGALGLIALSSIEVEKGKQKTLKNSEKEEEKGALLKGKKKKKLLIYTDGADWLSNLMMIAWLSSSPIKASSNLIGAEGDWTGRHDISLHINVYAIALDGRTRTEMQSVPATLSCLAFVSFKDYHDYVVKLARKCDSTQDTTKRMAVISSSGDS